MKSMNKLINNHHIVGVIRTVGFFLNVPKLDIDLKVKFN